MCRRLVIAVFCAMALQLPAQKSADQPSAKFASSVDVVLVPVVVRDRHGKAIGNLTQDNFRLFDGGRLQTITSFLAVRHGTGRGVKSSGELAQGDKPPERVSSSGGSNLRYFIYLFDDLNTRFADMAQLREAAVRHFQHPLAKGEEAAIYSLSGRVVSEFSNDSKQLATTAAKLRWRPEVAHGGMECPDVSYYIADLVITKGDAQAFAALTNHTMACARVPLEPAKQIAAAAATRELHIGAQDTQAALETVRRAIRRLSSMQGERVIILASPGFFAPTTEAARSMEELLDFAAKSNVIVNGLSPRGVIEAEEEENVAEDTGAVRRPPSQNSPHEEWKSYRKESAYANMEVMKDLAEGTGGTFFHDNNDLDLGFERETATAEFSYVLGFSPQSLKMDGRFHLLKVQVQNAAGVKVEARRGYYALTNESTDRRAQAEIDDAVFARNTRNDIPVVVQTGYSKKSDSDGATVNVIAKVDVATLHFQKRADRNDDFLRAVAVLFDADGGYVAGAEKTINLKLQDQTLRETDTGVTLRWEFGAKTGSYLIRLVIREADGRAMTMLNCPVVIQ